MKVRKGDTVKIISGKDKGKAGKVMHVFSKTGKISVEGINIYKKHVRPKKQGEKGEIVSVTRPFDISNVVILCPVCNKNSRVGFKIEEEKKMRMCKKCKATF